MINVNHAILEMTPEKNFVACGSFHLPFDASEYYTMQQFLAFQGYTMVMYEREGQDYRFEYWQRRTK